MCSSTVCTPENGGPTPLPFFMVGSMVPAWWTSAGLWPSRLGPSKSPAHEAAGQWGVAGCLRYRPVAGVLERGQRHVGRRSNVVGGMGEHSDLHWPAPWRHNHNDQ